MAVDIIARGMIESSKSDISQLFDITKGGEIVSNESSYTLNNAVNYPLLGLNLYGKSTQDGTPTPENPVDIVSVGDSGSVAVQACGKNIFPWNDYTTAPISRNNLSADKVVINSNVIKMNIPQGINKELGVYIHKSRIDKILFGQTGKVITLSCEVKSNYDVEIKFGLDYYKETFDSTTNGNRMSVTLTYNSSKNTSICWYVRNASNDTEIQISNIQIEIGDTATEYEPYKGNTSSITSALPLCGIPVSEGGNYTDGNGQKWVCDTLVYNADGTGKIIKRLGSFTIDGTEKFKTYDSTGTKEIVIVSEKYNEIKQPKSTRSVPIIISDILSSDTADNVWNMAKDNIIGVDYAKVENKNSLRIYSTYFSSAAVAKSFFTDNPKNIIAELAEPQEIELTAAEMAQLRALQTFNGITNITNGSSADMDVKICTNKLLAEYVNPITTGLQKQIDELKAAVLSLGGNV